MEWHFNGAMATNDKPKRTIWIFPEGNDFLEILYIKVVSARRHRHKVPTAKLMWSFIMKVLILLWLLRGRPIT